MFLQTVKNAIQNTFESVCSGSLKVNHHNICTRMVGYLESAIVHARNANLFKPVPFNTVFGDEKHCSKYKKQRIRKLQ